MILSLPVVDLYYKYNRLHQTIKNNHILIKNNNYYYLLYNINK